jgi:hypothetical protein
MTIVTLGIDLGKNLSSVVGLDADGRVVLRRRVRRATLAELAQRLESCTVGWRRAAVRTMSGGSSPRTGTRCG